MADAIRIVAMADTHLYHGDLDVPAGDWLIHAGDLTRGGSLAELDRAAQWLRALPHRVKIVIAGNHDRGLQAQPVEAAALLQGMTYLRDEAVVVDGLKVYGSPWQPRFFDWAFNLDRGPELAAVWAKIPDDTDVLVTHGPPAGIGDRVADDHRCGCADLLARVLVVRPRLHVFGHIHQDRGQWERDGIRFVNATTDEGQAPVTVLELPRRGA